MEIDPTSGTLALRSDLALAARHTRPPEPADAVAVTNLLQAYALVTDAGRRDELATLFTPDATWDGVELGYGRAEGAQSIADVVLVHADPDRPMVHLPGPPLLVAAGPDRIEAVSWCLATRLVDGVTRPLIYFFYEDVVCRTPDGWRFAARLLRLRFRAS